MQKATAFAERLSHFEPEVTASQQSLRAPDWLNFFKADAQTTVGPYLAIFLLAVRHWDLAKIGMVMAIPGLVTMLAQIPAGALVDRIERKRALVTLSALGLGAGCLLLTATTSFAAMVLTQGIIAIATIVMPPAIAAVSVGLVGHRAFARRMGRNEAFSHAGAVAAALVAGTIAYWIATVGLFYFAAVMSVLAAIAAVSIGEDEIDPAVAREAEVKNEGELAIISIRDLLRDSRIAILMAGVILFHLANAAMLPMLGEMLSAGRSTMAAPYMSACIIISQLVMMPIALATAWLADTWGRKPVFLLGLAALPIRGLLFALTRNPYLLVSIQIFDGVGAGIFGVVAVIIVADLAQRTGRFNLMRGAMNTCIAIGASVSNLVAGFVAEHAGYGAGFILLTTLAFLALVFFSVAMPETTTATHKQRNRG